jgi:hypothetical protein
VLHSIGIDRIAGDSFVLQGEMHDHLYVFGLGGNECIIDQ